MTNHSTEKDRILRVLREHWPESGGQVSHQIALTAQEACADALLSLPPDKDKSNG